MHNEAAALKAHFLDLCALLDVLPHSDPTGATCASGKEVSTQPNLPTWELWLALRELLNLPDALDAEVWRLNGRKGSHGDAWRDAEVIGEYGTQTFGFGNHRFSVKDSAIREPSKDAAAWKGWGTALKPAHEPIVIARKPLAGSVAENVLGFGTGALNIDACRVEAERPTGWGGGAAGGGMWNGGNCGLGKRGSARPRRPLAGERRHGRQRRGA